MLALPTVLQGCHEVSKRDQMRWALPNNCVCVCIAFWKLPMQQIWKQLKEGLLQNKSFLVKMECFSSSRWTHESSLMDSIMRESRNAEDSSEVIMGLVAPLRLQRRGLRCQPSRPTLSAFLRAEGLPKHREFVRCSGLLTLVLFQTSSLWAQKINILNLFQYYDF